MPPSQARRALSSVLLVAVAVAIAACASGGAAKRTSPDRVLASRLAHDDGAVTHFLNRATFGARDRDAEEIGRIGIEAFLDRQLHPERIDDSALERRLAPLDTLNLSSKQIAEQYYLPAQQARKRRALDRTEPVSAADRDLFRKERLVLEELSDQKVLRAIYSERQLQEVLVDFWFNHFNVFAGKGADRGLLTAYERDVIRPRVFGRFRDLLGATAESPAMLFFLDNWLSVDPNGPHPARPGGRYPGRQVPVSRSGRDPGGRFRASSGDDRAAQPKKPTRGLNENYARELMELHTLGVNGGYTQRDVVEVARCFTGWTIAQPRDGGAFSFNERQHDPGQKVVLGHVIRAGGGKNDGDQVLDILARDPHTARFIAAKLVRRFVSDDPPAPLVDRVARRFRETDGDLREAYRTIFLSEEFWSDHASKTKNPFEFVVSALRATSAQVEDAASLVQALRRLGMPPYFCLPPTGYPDRADAWVNTGGLLDRMNFVVVLLDGRLKGTSVDPGALAGGADLATARSRVTKELLGDRPAPGTREAMNGASSVPQLLVLALGSPDFQKK